MIGGLLLIALALFVFILAAKSSKRKQALHPPLLSEEGLSGMKLAVVRNRNAMIRGRSLGFTKYHIQCPDRTCPHKAGELYSVEAYFNRLTPMPPCRRNCPGWPMLEAPELK